MVLSFTSYVFDPRPHYPLLVTAKRYWQADSLHLDDPDALTLVFAHGIGFHKEQWEPTMDDICSLANGLSLKIREMWAIDALNHGEAAILNEKALLWGYEPIFGWEEYARCLHALLAGLGTGIDIDFGKRRLVGVGHSMGAISLLLAHGYHPRLKFSALVMCEPLTMAQELHTRVNPPKGVEKRRDVWSSREDAYNSMKSRSTWKAWDDRVLRIYAEHGLRPLPTATYPNLMDGVTLTCTRTQETACYRDVLGLSRAYISLRHIVRQVPTHIIYGALSDTIPYVVQDDVVDAATGGRQNLASLSKVKCTGHLVVQTNPKGLAEKIAEALTKTFGGTNRQARL